jgi:hypothetical protein
MNTISSSASLRCHNRITDHKIRQWYSIPWQYCPVCKRMLPD